MKGMRHEAREGVGRPNRSAPALLREVTGEWMAR